MRAPSWHSSGYAAISPAVGRRTNGPHLTCPISKRVASMSSVCTSSVFSGPLNILYLEDSVIDFEVGACQYQ